MVSSHHWPVMRQRPASEAGEDHNNRNVAGCAYVASGQRPAFEAGEDHNTYAALQALAENPAQRPASEAGEDHNDITEPSSGYFANCSVRPPRPARITTTSPPR